MGCGTFDMNVGKTVALRVFDTEIRALGIIKESLASDGLAFSTILEEILCCKGKVLITGMGKSGHIAKKIAASMSSLGTPSMFVHPGEAMHGDLGMIQHRDLVLAISYSGESEEIVKIIPNIIAIGATLIGMTANPNSTLARCSSVCEVFPPFREACPLGLAPSSSTTAALVYGDALAIAASEIKGFGKSDFALRHPSGSLGKKLTLRVSDCMTSFGHASALLETSPISLALSALCTSRTEIVAVYSASHELVGTFSGKDAKKVIGCGVDVYKDIIAEFINRDPAFTESDALAAKSLKMMLDNGYDYLLVMSGEKAVGVVRREDILKRGIYL